MKKFALNGLVAAVHTPFDQQMELNLKVVADQVAHLAKNEIKSAFIAGSTGESHSLSFDERITLAEAWIEAAKPHQMQVIVHVGSNCLRDAAKLAAHADKIGATAVAALAPSYFKPQTLHDLIDSCAAIASCAPNLPFYFYDIPVLTGVHFSMPQFIHKAEALIPNLRGVKFTNPDLMAYQKCLRTHLDIPWGIDEALLSAMALGATSAVGSSYNFAASIYHRMMDALEKGDWDTARHEQYQSVKLIEFLASYGYMAASKAVMTMLGVDVGPPRLPIASLIPAKLEELQTRVRTMGIDGLES